MELLLSDVDKLKIQKLAYVNEDHVSKKHFNRAVQELLIKQTKVEISQETEANFHKLFTFLTIKLKENSGN
jgi:hypothetical protein